MGRGKEEVPDRAVMSEVNKLQGYIIQYREYSKYFVITINEV